LIEQPKGGQVDHWHRSWGVTSGILVVVLFLIGAVSSLHAQSQDPTPTQTQVPAPDQAPTTLPGAAVPYAVAVLQGLDKTTARVSTFEAPIDLPARFGTLEITARACRKKPPTEPPESAAFLEIVDVRPDSPAVEVFSGWMFASSPAISALEHPVYDVWVIDCRDADAHPSTAGTPDAAPVGAGDSATEPGEFPEDPEGEAVPADETPAAN